MFWNLWHDVRYGARMFLRAPIVMTIAAISLALGISATTTSFAVANGFLFEPFPYEDQSTLVIVRERNRSESDDESVAPGNFLDWRERATVFKDLVAYTVRPVNLTGVGEPERINGVPVTPSAFRLLGRQPFLGRDFRETEGVDESVAILSYAFWQRRFGRDPSILGKVLTLDDDDYTVVGVMPEDFDFLPANVDAFWPTDLEDRRDDRNQRDQLVLGRLKPGIGIDRAQAELSAIGRQLESEHPETNEGYGVELTRLREYFPGPTDEKLVLIVLAVAGFVLLIACANVGNLLLARAEARQKEIAVRTALGGGHGRILRQLLTESLLLALLGGALGTVLSLSGTRFVAASMPALLPRSFLPKLDGTVLLFALGVTLAAGILFGLAPALHSLRSDIRDSLGEGTRGGTISRRRNRLRSVFVVGEVAMALALLTGSGILMKAFEELMNRDPGFVSDGLQTFQLTVPETRHASDEELVGFYNEILRKLHEIPAVEGVAAMIDLPRSRQQSDTRFTLDGRPLPRHNEEPTAGWQSVNAGYFDTLRIPLRRGRAFTAMDREDSFPVVIVNQALVERFFPEEDPLGHRITVHDESREIVGVTGNVLQARIPEGGSIGPALYLPMAQHPVRSMSFAVRVSGDPSSVAASVRSAIWSIDPGQPIAAQQALLDHIEAELSGPKVISTVLGTFGTVALLLSAIGIYGVMSHAVVQRTREIGIRMAFGAQKRQVVRMVTGQGMKLAVWGLSAGAPLAYAMIQAIRSALEGLTPLNPSLFGAVLLVLLGVALLSSYLPALRASRIRPAEALQTE